MKLLGLLLLVIFNFQLNLSLETSSEDVASYILQYAQSRRLSVGYMRAGKGGAQCYAKYIPQVTEIAQRSQKETEACHTHASSRQDDELNKVMEQRSTIDNQVQAIENFLNVCSNQSDPLEYLRCLSNDADSYVQTMKDIASNAMDIYGKIQNSITAIDKEEDNCVAKVIIRGKEDTDTVFEALQRCLINGFDDPSPDPENPDNPSEPENPENPDNPSDPENPENPDTPSEPENPENPDTPIEPENPENPDTPSEPENPENPDTPSEPENPENPDTPSEPENPENPDTPSEPENPENPDTPSDPENPENPDTPSEPENPENPDESGNEQPANPDNSENPEPNPDNPEEPDTGNAVDPNEPDTENPSDPDTANPESPSDTDAENPSEPETPDNGENSDNPDNYPEDDLQI